MKNYNKLSVKDLPEVFQKRFERYDNLFRKETGKSFIEDKLWEYEIMCWQQAMCVADFVKSQIEKLNITAQEYFKNAEDWTEITKGIVGWSENHTGNSASMSIRLAYFYLTNPKYVVIEHGCLAGLVGDAGYHDDRKDIPEFLKE